MVVVATDSTASPAVIQAIFGFIGCSPFSLCPRSGDRPIKGLIDLRTGLLLRVSMTTAPPATLAIRYKKRYQGVYEGATFELLRRDILDARLALGLL